MWQKVMWLEGFRHTVKDSFFFFLFLYFNFFLNTFLWKDYWRGYSVLACSIIDHMFSSVDIFTKYGIRIKYLYTRWVSVWCELARRNLFKRPTKNNIIASTLSVPLSLQISLVDVQLYLREFVTCIWPLISIYTYKLIPWCWIWIPSVSSEKTDFEGWML